jgi:hypothetical protein
MSWQNQGRSVPVAYAAITIPVYRFHSATTGKKGSQEKSSLTMYEDQ